MIGCFKFCFWVTLYIYLYFRIIILVESLKLKSFLENITPLFSFSRLFCQCACYFIPGKMVPFHTHYCFISAYFTIECDNSFWSLISLKEPFWAIYLLIFYNFYAMNSIILINDYDAQTTHLQWMKYYYCWGISCQPQSYVTFI